MGCKKMSVAWKLDGFFVALLIIEGIAVTISNMLVVLAIIREQRLRNSRYMPVMSLAMADSLNGLITIAVALIAVCRNDNIQADLALNLAIGLVVFGHSASITNLIVVCCDRWVVIFRPLRYRVLLNSKRMYILIASAWLLAVLVTIPIAFMDKLEIKLNVVSKHEKVYVLTLLSMFVCISIVLGWMQLRTICTVRQHLRRIFTVTEVTVLPATSTACSSEKKSQFSTNCNGQSSLQRHSMQREYALTIASNCVYLLIIVTWSPFLLIVFMHLAGACPTGCKTAMQYTVVLLEINSLVNPIIYAVRLREIRSAVRSMFRSLRCSRS